MIDKRSKTILYILMGAVILLFAVESSRPRPVEWTMSFTSGDKIPYGCYVLYDQLSNVFPGQKIRPINQVPVDFLRSQNEVTNANYIFINNSLAFDRVEAEHLIDFASRGNKVFIASQSAYGALSDSLGLETNSEMNYEFNQGDTIRTRLSNSKFKIDKYTYDRGASYRYFEVYDTLKTKVLGEILPFKASQGVVASFITGSIEDSNDPDQQEEASDSEETDNFTTTIPQVNFVEVKVGEGAIYYNLNPIAFTNYYMLKDGMPAYASEVFSYLNEGPVFFDDYGKSGRKVIKSPLRFILSQPALKWAYYLAVLAVLLYMIFVSKRKQRIIPIVEPPNNSTVDFTKTIGSLYFESRDYSSIINKKISYFLEKVRSMYYLNTQELSKEFIKRLATKSGKDLKQTEDLVNYIAQLRSKPMHNENELKQLNKKIDLFFNT
jgi:hypothetical protein